MTSCISVFPCKSGARLVPQSSPPQFFERAPYRFFSPPPTSPTVHRLPNKSPPMLVGSLRLPMSFFQYSPFFSGKIAFRVSVLLIFYSGVILQTTTLPFYSLPPSTREIHPSPKTLQVAHGPRIPLFRPKFAPYPQVGQIPSDLILSLVGPSTMGSSILPQFVFLHFRPPPLLE